jgi:hypothetical protein
LVTTLPAARHEIERSQRVDRSIQARSGRGPNLEEAMRRMLLAAPLAIVVLIASAGAALADPSASPGASTGTADCGSAGTFTFTVSGSNGQGQGTTWNPAFISNGSQRGIFVPEMLSLTYTGSFGSFSFSATKGGAPDGVTCSISGSNAFASFSGTVQGFIVWRG